jgi:stalled ribosome alternative rescue factor ArfA
MFGMVYIAFQQNNELIDNNYYEKEVKYQSLIDASRRLNDKYGERIFIQKGGLISIKLPLSLLQSFNNGKIELLKNDDESKDIRISFMPDSLGAFNIEKSKFGKGSYTARVEWYNDKTMYYRTEKLILD